MTVFKSILCILLLFFEYTISNGSANEIIIKSDSDRLKDGTYKWKVYIDADHQTISKIKFVEYFLHPSFLNNIRKTYSRSDKYSINFTSQSEFKISIRIHYNNSEVESYSHDLIYCPKNKIGIKDISIKDIFPSLYLSYSKGTSSIADIDVCNGYDDSIKVKLSLYIKDYMNEPTITTVQIQSQNIKKVSMHAIFSQKILTNTTPNRVTIKFEINYKYKNKSYKEKFDNFGIIYPLGALTWDDPNKTAAFITYNDLNIKMYAEHFIAMGSNILGQEYLYLSQEILNSMYIFESLSLIGLKYRPDPSYPFEENKYTVDYLQYPFELIESKNGDCGDLVILYSALLESIGIESNPFIGQDHIIILINSGISDTDLKKYSISDNLFILRKEYFWIPIEMTQIESSFAQAWLTGINYYRENETSPYSKIIDLRTSLNKYPPKSINESVHVLKPEIDVTKLKIKLKKDIVELKILK